MSDEGDKSTTTDKVEDIVESDPVEKDTDAAEPEEVQSPKKVAGDENKKTDQMNSSHGETLRPEGENDDVASAAADDEEAAIGDDGSPLAEEDRNKMFERGLALDQEGDKSAALKCYLKCLVGLKRDSKFALLPQCLRNIGDIYYGKNEYDKAISFIQAEKLYYESVLIDDSELQRHIDEVTSSVGECDTNIDLLRASEYEQLAKLCMDEKQPQLALEYAGKATKLRQKVYGSEHPIVKQSLDYFATIYAEVGKVQYSESLRKFDTAGEPDMTGEVNLDQSTGEPTSILRKRKNTEGEKEEKKVRFVETQVPAEEMEREEKCAVFFLFVLFLLLVFVLVLLGLYIYCSLYPSDTCVNFRHFVTSAVMKVRFWFYQFSNKPDAKFV